MVGKLASIGLHRLANGTHTEFVQFTFLVCVEPLKLVKLSMIREPNDEFRCFGVDGAVCCDCRR